MILLYAKENSIPIYLQPHKKIRAGTFRQYYNEISQTVCSTCFCFIHVLGVLQDSEMLQDYEEDKLRKTEQGRSTSSFN